MPSVSGKRVLIFGDSLSSGMGSPGDVMAGYLRGRGATTKISAVVGRSAWNFYTAREDSAAVIADCQAFHADLAIVELGTNDLGLGASVDRDAMARLRSALAAGGTEVWAVGPPMFASQERNDQAVVVVSTMRSVFGGNFIDWRPLSRDMTSPSVRTADGVHFNATGGGVAGERLANAFTSAGGIGIGTLAVIAALAWLIWR